MEDDFFESGDFALISRASTQEPEEQIEVQTFSLDNIVKERPTQEEQARVKAELKNGRFNILNPARTCVPHTSQSLLHAIFLLNPYIRKTLAVFKKAPLSKIIGEYVGARPQAIFFSGEEFSAYKTRVEEMIEHRGAIYLKENTSDSGLGVYRIRRREGGYRVEQPQTQELRLAALEDFPFKKGETYVLEEEIPIARVAGRTWEIRTIAPYENVFTYGKVAIAPTTHLNNYARGGYEGNAEALVRKVLEYQGLGKEEREKEARRFMQESMDLSQRVKRVTDDIQVSIAKTIFEREEICAEYETTMAHAFSGTFFVVDITGVFKEGRLEPMIIEAQASAGLPEQIGFAAHKSVRAYFSQKFRLLQEVLI